MQNHSPITRLQSGRVFNFSAGPAVLPTEVLEEARDEILNWNGTGMSVMELSHRSKDFEYIIENTKNSIRKLINLPQEYEILFLQGGASLQFSMIPMNFLTKDHPAGYIITGSWGQKAHEAATLVGETRIIYDAKNSNYNHVPNLKNLSYSSNTSYLHFTSNETIQGTEFNEDPSLPGTVICDMSSNLLSRPVEITKYQMIYASAQKNIGPAGVTIILIKKELLDRVPKGMAPMLDYRLQAKNNSLYNTPPCWSIYICGLMCDWLLKKGGISKIKQINDQKAKLLYDSVDQSDGFYKGHAEKKSRSNMNVTFTLPSEELTKDFIKQSEEQGFVGLAGHRSVGGCRASIYNAFPIEGCEELAKFMKIFQN